VHGRVTELASATSGKYNIALAVLLGRDMDSVIVDSEAIAKDCIKFLKDTHVPPMTFYPLPSIKVCPDWLPGGQLAASLHRQTDWSCGQDVG